MSNKFSEYPQYDNDTTTDCEDCEAKIRTDAIDKALQSYIHWIENEDRENVSFEEVLLRLKEQKNE